MDLEEMDWSKLLFRIAKKLKIKINWRKEDFPFMKNKQIEVINGFTYHILTAEELRREAYIYAHWLKENDDLISELIESGDLDMNVVDNESFYLENGIERIENADEKIKKIESFLYKELGDVVQGMNEMWGKENREAKLIRVRNFEVVVVKCG